MQRTTGEPEIAGGLRSLALSLHSRCREIERAIFSRWATDARPIAIGDREYVESTKAAIRAAIEHAIESLKHRDPEAQEVPVPRAITQYARLATTRSIPLETLMLAAQLAYDTILEYVEHERLSKRVTARARNVLARAQAREVVVIVEAHRRAGHTGAAELVQASLVRDLLAGREGDVRQLEYPLDAWHIGFISNGEAATTIARAIVAARKHVLLVKQAWDETIWGWVATEARLDPRELPVPLPQNNLQLGFGEPGRGLEGWRRTHHQASLALDAAAHLRGRHAHYGDIALIELVRADTQLVEWLTARYLTPLRTARYSRELLTETLRIYFDSDRIVNSVARRMDVSRQTVHQRLKAIEGAIGSLRFHAELDLALRLDESRHKTRAARMASARVQ